MSSSPIVPFKLRHRSISSADDMPPFDSYNRIDSSSPASSSPLPPTPCPSSSPPGYPRIQCSPGYSGMGDISDYNDDYDDISAVWPRGHRGHGSLMRGIYASIPAPFPLRSDDEPSRTSKSDASGIKEHVILDDRDISPDDTDEEDEYDVFGEVQRQTCFATSSERGRWKSSPIPIKTYSRSSESALSRPKENGGKINKPGNSNSRLHTEWRRPSTASSISDPPESPIALTLPSMSEEPISRHQTSSPLPPSSPPTSPVSIALSMPESDYTTEEDMLVDSDDEHQSQHVTEVSSSQSLSVNEHSLSESDSEAKQNSLIPDIATLSFLTACKKARPASTPPQCQPPPQSQSLEPTLIRESVVFPPATAMPTPEPTPAPSERDPMPPTPVQESPPTPPKSIISHAPVKPAAIAKLPSASASTKQSFAKNEGQNTTPMPAPMSGLSSTHIPMPTPMDVDVGVKPTPIPTAAHSTPLLSSSTSAVSTAAPTAYRIATRTTIDRPKSLVTKKASQSHLAQGSAAELSLPMDVDAVSSGPSRPATPSATSRMKKGSVNRLQKAPLANKKNQPHPGQSTDSAQMAINMDVDVALVTSVSAQKGTTTAKEKGGNDNLLTRTDEGQGEMVKGKAKKDKDDLPDGHIKPTEKTAGDVGEVGKKVVKPRRPSKPIAPKAGPSKQSPSLDTAEPKETHHMNDVIIGRGKDKKERVKRQKKVEEGDEGPVKKKKKVVKDGTTVVKRSISKDADESLVDVEGVEKVKTATSTADPSSCKPKTKKAKAPNPMSNSSKPSSNHPPNALNIDPSQLAELQGMVIESFAVSRASALPVSALYRSITDNRPSLKTEHSQEKWMELIEGALEDGQSNCGVFGKVESSFKDDSDLALEAKWFYVPERDLDQERAMLISNMMPRAAKRTETKKYKQYYYQPLDKISRWDPEDDL